jgi:hypothetical protein
MASRIPEDLDRLQADLTAKLRGCGAAHQAAGAQVLIELQELWADNTQGIPEASVRLINGEIVPLIDAALKGSSPGVVRAAVDDLVAAWRRLKPRLILP